MRLVGGEGKVVTDPKWGSIGSLPTLLEIKTSLVSLKRKRKLEVLIHIYYLVEDPILLTLE